jgi:hypothetical protein
VRRTFATPDGCDLLVENTKGQIVVEGWDRPETEVDAVRHEDWAELSRSAKVSESGQKLWEVGRIVEG